MVDLVEAQRCVGGRLWAIRVWLWSHIASGQVTETKPLTALWAEFWLVIFWNWCKFKIDFFPAKTVLFAEEPNELSHINWSVSTCWSVWLLLLTRISLLTLIYPVVVSLQVKITKFVSNEKVAIGIHKSTFLVSFKLTGYSSTLLKSHDFLTLFAIKDGVISYLLGSFGRTVPK